MAESEKIAEAIDKEVQIPDTLPILPVRDIVVFPYMIIPLFVGREISIKAIEHALNGSRMILLLTQKDLSVETPEVKDSRAGTYQGKGKDFFRSGRILFRLDRKAGRGKTCCALHRG
jgi:ATP-dependent Lon protease